MDKIEFAHGGPDYDKRYPDGIPTSVVIESGDGTSFDSGMVMYPCGHARNKTGDLDALLRNKWKHLAAIVSDDGAGLIARFNGMGGKSAAEVASINDFAIAVKGDFE
jgi:2-methylcitrate dehydratase